ncbi:hypothetical protein [Aeromonas sp. BIGb0445]|uniref:hypothetical protein n=1 Tax=Aeromonas sp. BIGb0445 TaxID=2940593 RepID=UPI00216A6784|nr:hypothetical protein [Aeromonas sp. BIGb0445]MCS3458458.1 hypothetical protein [Aeromonas sp. BIGb0445]
MNNNLGVSECHLQLIQNNIGRLAGNSFMIKGWSITLISALFAISAKESHQEFVLLAYFPAIIFWGLDGFYLGMERRFVAMYTATVQGTVPSYEINPHSFTSDKANMWSALFSRTLLLFHGSVIAGILIVMIFI